MKKYFVTSVEQPGMYKFLPAGIEADYKAQEEVKKMDLSPLEGTLNLEVADYYKQKVLSVYSSEEEAIIAAHRGENNLIQFKTVGTYAGKCTLYREYQEIGSYYPRFGLLLKNAWDFSVVPYPYGKFGYVPCQEWKNIWTVSSYGRIPHEEGMENRLIQVF